MLEVHIKSDERAVGYPASPLSLKSEILDKKTTVGYSKRVKCGQVSAIHQVLLIVN